ncbi:MAG TPA: hypothetical protein VFX97_02880 [Pyrinomonadaceae bacterium]|nr:hypothetical protein [Pyrinomonadaceae bacterium]
MTEAEFNQFEHESTEYLKAQQGILREQYSLGGYERWDYNQETGEFIFSDKGVAKLIADFQVVGTLSTISNTWLWSWANPSILESVKTDILVVKQFGEEHNLEELTQEKWNADELDGWAMTSVSAKLLNAKGAYRCPDDKGFTFIIFTNLRRMSA